MPGVPYTIQIYAVVCTPVDNPDSPVVRIANKTQTTLDVHGLRMFTEYKVQVVALRMHTASGALKLKGSQAVLVSTAEGGKWF